LVNVCDSSFAIFLRLGRKLSDRLPKKLKDDAIVEVAFEIRFDAEAIVPEVALGRLADTPDWHGFSQRRLPTADLPPAVRRADPNLRHLATIELVAPNGDRRVGIGPQNLSFTRAAPYPGWDGKFGVEVEGIVDILFKTIPKPAVTRLGLRYVNALRSTLHGIAGIESLNLRVSLGPEVLTQKLNLNYTVPVLTDSSCTVRIASADLAGGNIPEGTTVIADLDVYTNDGYSTGDSAKVKAWCADAHDAEKLLFFRLLNQATIDRLRLD
jgi:uncharacterized protein (TIGR04255 family)